METDVRRMQQETEELENIYKELLLLSTEFKLIKKNEINDDDAEERKNPGSINVRNDSDVGSIMSMELEMMMDVPDDQDEVIE